MRFLVLFLAFFTLALPALAAEKESAYERVMKTQTIRCGYIPYSFNLKIDPNTGAKSGVFYDVMEEIGRLMNIKIEWAEELTWATVATSLQSGRVDAFCSSMWVDTQNGKVVAYTQPLFYNSVSAYGRADESRYKTLDYLNAPEVRVVSRDGGTSAIVQQQDFPQATLVSLPSGVSDGEMIQQILTGKADVIFYGDDMFADYLRENPGKLKALFPDKLRVYATSIALPIDDPALQNMLNNALTEVKGSGFIEKALKKHAPEGAWLNEMPR